MVAAELLAVGAGQRQADHRLADHRGGGHNGGVGSLAQRLGGLLGLGVDRRSGLVRVEIGLIAARTTSGWPLVIPPSRPPARLVSRK